MAGCDMPPDTFPRDDSWKMPEWDPDSDYTDADTGTGVETDTGADTEGLVTCEDEPAVCEEIDEDEEAQFYGCCFDKAVYWCQDYGNDWLLVEKDCESLGLDCGYLAEQDFLWCI
jgi:hypothetical protein